MAITEIHQRPVWRVPGLPGRRSRGWPASYRVENWFGRGPFRSPTHSLCIGPPPARPAPAFWAVGSRAHRGQPPAGTFAVLNVLGCRVGT